MTPDQFLSLAEVLPEAMWLLSTTGVIAAGNAAAGRLVGRAPHAFSGLRLSEVVADAPAYVTDYLRACSRTRALTLGTLTFRHVNSTTVACRAEGALLARRTADAPAALLLRCKPKPVATQPFVALNNKIQELIRANMQLRRMQTLLQYERERFEVTLTSIGDAVMATDTTGRITFMNPVAETLTGWSAHEAMSKDLSDVFHIINMETREPVESPVTRVLCEGTVVRLANHTLLLAKDGSERPIDDSGAPIRGPEGHLVGVVLAFRDASDRRRAEAALEASAAQLRLVTDSAPVFLAHCNAEGRYRFVNRPYAERLGLSREQVIGKRIPEVVGEAAYASFQAYVERALAGEAVEFVVEIPYQGIGPRWMHCSYVPELDPSGAVHGLIAVITDVTERQQMEEQLRASLQEKEILLKEVHHRVKNNLQVVSSLLSLQSATVQTPAVQDFVQESERRIRAMALVHETLYQGSDVAQFQLAKYVRTLSEHLIRAYGGDAARIALHVEVEAVVLSLDTAVPCGLILSELLSNCLKHAFPNGQAGEITVTLTREADHMRLTVRDNGCGFPEHFDFRLTESLGLQLVCALTEQLHGTLTLQRKDGTAVAVTFPLPGGRGA